MRAVGIVRQSRGRDDSISPAEQRARIGAICEREGMQLLAVHEEIDVSGGTPLVDREGLRAAVEAVEAGSAEVVVVAYFDRLFRSLRVQGEVVARIEAAGGQILAADVGVVSEASPAQWISGTMLGVVSEYYRRSVRERSGAAQARAVDEGRIVYEKGPPGYEVQDGRLVPSSDAPLIAEAFERRAAGETVLAIRAMLAEHGIRRSFSSVQRLLANRSYLGELRFGGLVNLDAHEAIVDRATFDRVQRVRETRGTRPVSARLLARLGVLRCGSCGARMVVGVQTQNGRRYPFYRCPPVGDCPKRQTISAEIAERETVAKVRELIDGMEGRASAGEAARRADETAERAQADLDAAVKVIGDWRDASAVERLDELRAVRDAAVERRHELSGLRAALTVTGSDWEALTLDEQREVIRGAVRVTVSPGRGAERLSFESLL